MFLEISQNSQENTCARVSFFNKVAGLSPLLKKRLWHRCFSVNFAKFLRKSFFIEHLWWLLLYSCKLNLTKKGTTRSPKNQKHMLKDFYWNQKNANKKCYVTVEATLTKLEMHSYRQTVGGYMRHQPQFSHAKSCGYFNLKFSKIYFNVT